MKLFVIICLSVVFHMDSVSSLTFNEVLSYIPGWDALVSTWEHIKQVIKRPVVVKRWDHVKLKTTTSPKTSTTTETTTTSTPPILQSNKMKTRYNATREETMELKITSPKRNITTNLHTSSILTPRKMIVPLILPLTDNRPFTSAKTLLLSVDLPTTSTKSSISADSSIAPKSVLFVRSINRLTTSKMYVPTSFIPPTTSTLTVMTTSTPDAVRTKRTFEYAVIPRFGTDKADITAPDDFATLTAPNEGQVNVPYISSPVFRSAEDWRRLQLMPFASALSVKEAENDASESMVAEGRHEEKELSDTEKESFGSLSFI